MGHSSSSAICDKKALVVDLASAKGAERLAAVALTKTNVPSIDCHLFTGLYQVRCEDSVHHWFQATHPRDVLPPVPSKEAVYADLIVDSGEKSAGPVPIAIIRVTGELHGEAHQPPSLEEILRSQEFDVVGYVACRSQGDSTRETTPQAVCCLEFFMTKVFQNEAKSLSLLEIACKCYMRFARQAPAKSSRMKSSAFNLQVAVLQSNLPLLRLLQKVFSLMPEGLRRELQEKLSVFTSADPTSPRVVCSVLDPNLVEGLMDTLAHYVVTTAGRLVLNTHPVDKLPDVVLHKPLEDVIAFARQQWKESNRVVIESTKPQNIIPSCKDSRTRFLRIKVEKQLQTEHTPTKERVDTNKTSTASSTPSAEQLTATSEVDCDTSSKTTDATAPTSPSGQSSSDSTTSPSTQMKGCQPQALVPDTTLTSLRPVEPSVVDDMVLLLGHGTPVHIRQPSSGEDRWDCVCWGSEKRRLAVAEVQAHEGYLCLVPLDPPYNIVDVFHLPQPSSISSSSVPDPIPFIEPYLVEDGCIFVDPEAVYCYSDSLRSCLPYVAVFGESVRSNNSNGCSNSYDSQGSSRSHWNTNQSRPAPSPFEFQT